MIDILIFFVFIFLGVGYFTLLERKILAASQIRLGVNKVGVKGLFQPLLDGIKLLSKELFLLEKGEKFIFFLGPSFALIVLLVGFSINNFKFLGKIFDYQLFSLIFVFSLGSFPIFIRSLAGRRKYSILGGVRIIIVIISYEILLSFIFFVPFFILKGFQIFWSGFSFFFFSFLIISLFVTLSECNRAPFDLREGERELVSGFNVEFFSSPFTQIFLSEYGIILFFGANFSIIFINGRFILFFFYVYFCLFCRSCFPRIRPDCLVSFIWKSILPFTILLSFSFFFFLIKLIFDFFKIFDYIFVVSSSFFNIFFLIFFLFFFSFIIIFLNSWLVSIIIITLSSFFLIFFWRNLIEKNKLFYFFLNEEFFFILIMFSFFLGDGSWLSIFFFIKIGLPPFHFWILNLIKNNNLFIVWFLTFQKFVPSLIIIFSSCIFNVLNFIIVMFFINNFLIVITKSINIFLFFSSRRTSILIFFLSCFNIFYSLFLLFYYFFSFFFFLFSFFKNSNVDKEIRSLFFFFVRGLPPFLIFFLKFFSFGYVYIFFGWIISFLLIFSSFFSFISYFNIIVQSFFVWEIRLNYNFLKEIIFLFFSFIFLFLLIKMFILFN